MSMSHIEKNNERLMKSVGTNIHTIKLAQIVFFNYWSTNLKIFDYCLLSENPNITWEIVQNNPDKPWTYSMLSQNPNITWEIIKNNSNKSWDYSLFSKNPNITWKIVQQNPDKPWSYSYLSQNENRQRKLYK